MNIISLLINKTHHQCSQLPQRSSHCPWGSLPHSGRNLDLAGGRASSLIVNTVSSSSPSLIGADSLYHTILGFGIPVILQSSLSELYIGRDELLGCFKN